MPHTRKTADTWELHINYGQGWEHEITEFSLADARQRLGEYRTNCPQYPAKIIKRRVPILELSEYERQQGNT